MESQIEVPKQKKNQRQSIFFISNQNSNQCDYEYNDTQVDRSRQKYLFQIQNTKLQYSHHGDSEIEESSFQDRKSSSRLKLKSQLDAENTLQDSFNDITKQISQKNQYLNDEINCSVAAKNDYGASINEIQKDKEESDIITDNSQNIQQLKSSNIYNDQKSANNQDKSSMFYSQNFIENLGNASQTVKSENRPKNHTKTNLEDKVWLKEDIFYEKNFKKLGTKVNFALKSHYIEQQENNHQAKNQQNFQKAANIINRLLNSSMNRVMKIRQHVQNFINLLKVRHVNRRINDLKENEYNLINDFSNFYQEKNKKGQIYQIQLIFNYFERFSKLIPIFMPTDIFRVCWDMILVIFTYSFCYIYSLFIFIEKDDLNLEFNKKFYLLSFIVFVADIIINLNTALFNKDSIITKRKLIAKKYFFSSTFITDFLSLLILSYKVIYQSELTNQNENYKLFRYASNILVFLKVNGVSHKKKGFNYLITLTENQKHIVKLANQIASVITAAHIAAIGWYFLGIQESQNNVYCWLDKLSISSQPYYEKYVYSIYWSITTMTTVGYGDIAATNYIEALYISITMILFSCVFAYSINNIGFILQEIEKSSKQLNDDMTIIQRYLIRKDVNIQLKSRVRHYLSFLADEQKDRDKQAEDKIFSALSNKLREEITREINSKILNSYFLFSSNFSQATLNKIIFIMEEVLINPNEVIINEWEHDDSSIYFIQSGIIEIYYQQIQNKPNIINILRDGQIFGELSFFSGMQRQASARSVNLSTLYKISRSKFVEILKENSEDFERFKMMQDLIVFQNDLSSIHTECYSCKSVGHIAIQCPRTHNTKDKQLIILRNNYSTFQDRIQAQRKKKRIQAKRELQIKQNKEVINRLKQNLKQLNDPCYLLFETQDNLLNSEYSQSIFQNDEDEEEDESLTQLMHLDEQSTNSINFSKVYNKKKTEKLFKSLKKNSNFQQSGNNENGSSANIDNQQCHSNNSLQNQENSELRKAFSKTLCSYAKTKSSDGLENINSNNLKQESSYRTLSNGLASESRVNKNENDSFIQNQLPHQFQNEEDDGNEEQEQELAKQQILLQNFNYFNLQQPDYEKFQVKQNSNFNIKQSYQILRQQTDDLNLNQAKEGQMQQASTVDNQNKPSTNISIQAKSKKNFSQKSLKQLNQSHREHRCSVDQMILQNIIVNGLFSDNRFSQQQLKNSSNLINNIQEMIEKSANNNSGKSFTENKEKMNSQKSTLSQKVIKSQIQNGYQEDIEFIKRLSRIIQGTNIPLLLQLTNGKSFLNPADSQVLSCSMDHFEKLYQFKKYFPQNNFDKVIQKLKQYLSMQKKQKKNKLATKQRRNNIGLTNARLSIFHTNSNVLKVIQEYNINQYKPTHLSYGVKMLNGVNFPTNFLSLQKL